MKNLIYISDFFEAEVLGGAEISDGVLIDYLAKEGHNIKTVKSEKFDPTIHKADTFIISNFVGLSGVNKNWFFSSGVNYIIIERDQKYVRSRNTAMYKDFAAPESEVVNQTFYRGAQKVFCLTNHSADLLLKHIDLTNVESLGCTQFSQEQFDYIRKMYKESKNGKWCIVPGKRSNKAMQLCEIQKIDYDYLKNCQWKELMETMSEYEGLVFFSHAVETCCRLVVEARMLGLKVKTDNRVGCTYEDWFDKYKGIELIDFLEKKVHSSLEIIEGQI